MSRPVLVIGNFNYSSWSLRAWIALRVLGVDFETVRIPLYLPDSKARLLAVSPAGKVPCYIDGSLRAWDSIAILETLAETSPTLLPDAPAARALARSISAEMHAGFPALREHMSMNIRKRFPGAGRSPEVLAEIARIQSIWRECRERYGAGGPFLFGRFGMADAMYAPIVLRFRTYAVALDAPCRAYCDAMLALPAMAEWIDAAEREVESIPKFERYD